MVGAFIVGNDRERAVSKKWQELTDATISADALTKSLPHRDDADRQRIADGYLGATTWAAIVQEFGLPDDLLDD